MKKFVLVAVAPLVAVSAVALAQQSLHGAASATAQQDALSKWKLTADPPRGVDPETWARAIPADNTPTPERIALGQKLFFDARLSRDGSVSCSTCHDVTRSFTDRRAVAEGIGDQLGRRNSPTVLNASLLHTFFWDGRAGSLEDQAGQPILNPVEMGQPDRVTVETALQVSEDGPLFQKAYGREINYGDVQRAIASFERTLNFLEAPFDKFVAGDTNAISADARAGWDLFNGKARCVACHAINGSNPLGTDNRFHNIGVSARKQDFESLASKALRALAKDSSERALDELALASDLSELGRFVVTRNNADIGSFRTSPIRNIGITAPYMHDGSLQTLWDVMDHYNKGGEANPYLDGGIEALALGEKEIDQVVAFLFTLTDERFSALGQSELERQQALSRKNRPFRDDDLAQRKVIGFEKRALGRWQVSGKNVIKSVETKYMEERESTLLGLGSLDRRSFMKVSLGAMAAAAASGVGINPHSFTPVSVAYGDEPTGFKFAYISDSHLYKKELNDRFVRSLLRAVDDVNALDPQPDFVLYGGDLAQLGQREELDLGAQILKSVKAPMHMMVGEHDWYLDMGARWRELFGEPHYGFDHKGVHFVVLNSVVEEDFWTAANLTPMERMKTVAGLDNGKQRPFTVGAAQREWLTKHLEPVKDETPLIVFSHSPLYKLYKQWNFWTDDADEIQAILRRFKKVVVIHGHTHQVLTNRIDNIHFHGMLSTAWPWPYAPQGLPELTIQMNRPDPFNPNDGCGNGSVSVHPDGLVDKLYNLWNRNPMTVSSAYLSSGGKTARPLAPNAGSY